MKTRFRSRALPFAILAASLTHLYSPQLEAQTNMVYDDDIADDVDPGNNFATLHKLADRGEINILAVMANSKNTLSAPAAKVYNTYYGRPNIPIGFNKTSFPTCPHDSACNGSTWLTGLIAQFNPGDTGANYPDCVTLYRTVLAAQPNASVTIVETGFMTCLSNLLTSPGDGISPLTGVQLVQAKVAQLVVMGGYYPSGTEYNFANYPQGAAAVFSTWTTQNGYPPIWCIDFNAGNGVQAGPYPYSLTTVNPARLAFSLAGTTLRGSWDSLAILYAARGLSYGGVAYWTDSGNGTNTVNSSTGANSWSSSTASGQHYLINALSNSGFEAILDGYSNAGFAGQPPLVGRGAMVQ